MSAKELATISCTFKFENPEHSGTIVSVFVPALKVKCSGVNAWTSVVLTLSACTNGTVTAGTGLATMIGDSTKVKSFTLALGRKGTKISGVTVTGVIGTSPGQTYTTNILVDSPGQTKVKVE
jgi:hypothetical protein